MYNERLKASAIARIKSRIPLEEISEDLDIPYTIVKEWAENLGGKDLIGLEANIHAATKLANQEIMPLGDTENEEALKTKLFEVAIEIAEETSGVVAMGDPITAKALQLCADTVTKLYSTFIIKKDSPQNINQTPSSDSLTMFQGLLRD